MSHSVCAIGEPLRLLSGYNVFVAALSTGGRKELLGHERPDSYSLNIQLAYYSTVSQCSPDAFRLDRCNLIDLHTRTIFPKPPTRTNRLFRCPPSSNTCPHSQTSTPSFGSKTSPNINGGTGERPSPIETLRQKERKIKQSTEREPQATPTTPLQPASFAPATSTREQSALDENSDLSPQPELQPMMFGVSV